MKYHIEQIIESGNDEVRFGEHGREVAAELLEGKDYTVFGLNPIQAGTLMALVCLSAREQGLSDLEVAARRIIDKLQTDMTSFDILDRAGV